jgi:hypothetical protein
MREIREEANPETGEPLFIHATICDVCGGEGTIPVYGACPHTLANYRDFIERWLNVAGFRLLLLQGILKDLCRDCSEQYRRATPERPHE